MLDVVINIGFGILALVVIGPVDRFIERRTNRTYEEAWRRVQEETKTKG